MSPVATLGDVLYPDSTRERVSEEDWVQLVRRIAGGDQLALHALYQRSHRLVFTSALRITASRETADEVTVDVFYDVWRRAGGYDPENGTVLGWIMNQARSRALDRLRFQQRRKRTDPGRNDAHDEPSASVDAVESKQQSEMLLRAVGNLSAGERQAIEAAYFSELTHAEVAMRLNEPLGTVKTRIRSALQKLRQALAGEGIQR
ncbi:MAG TPA: sigma-70 family RNA polymerase sigma factor [Ramlibacter sp.]|nr:sigma-70 family RNA polymerase sigma factor [Ramlibacter sp.]